MPFLPQYRYLQAVGLCGIICLLVLFFPLFLPKTPAGELETEWGGHLQLRGESAWPDHRATLAAAGTDPLVDGSADFRLKSRVYWNGHVDLKTHYEFIATGGDTRKKTANLVGAVPAAFLSALSTVNDRRRLLDLTATVDDGTGHVAYHRLDRLALSLHGSRATVTLGRQALTWGNGLVFNPMDLFNPFAPTDTDRDYKLGDDMALVRMPDAPVGDLQLLYVPRRDIITQEVSWDASSLAVKAHRSAGTTEFDVLAARHYRDYVLGLGATGYIADAAWRADGTWTRRFGAAGRSDFFSLVANIDYSWVWGGKNWYGLAEVFFSGIGSDDAAAALSDPALLERLARGEAYTLGRTYLAVQVQYEIHPLVNLHLAAITHAADPSGLLQPRAVWDAAQNLQITLGGALSWGGAGTEFGGFQPVAGGPWVHSADSAYLKMSLFF